ncbi:glycosyltransferase [Afipia carboxidovorans OM5]|uniref:Glycosyl transferase n=1 Tax=Afipia carboxidovorans (strain ATCC 49405 / DSM 1227 / KCTC 32145 / OM5) TaxID=504832 RepID=B6JIE3_AFIC5|nr:glycosyltransferase family 4 protein [Afipia carboxidovorans]ACI94187.1 glycosyltransferase [Afipia carboxidovorans OM5]AEI02161.1 glycosyl transferase [Afipia carboxidovorans OM4]AEI05737.1 glycosyl transferase [Afipia carboxidovorans OM5]
MRVLISTVAFPPSVGGMETAALDIASGLAERGHDVTVAATTPSSEPDRYPFKVVRNPDAKTMWNLTRDTDVVWQNHISLRLVWPALVLRRPVVFMHHIWLDTDPGSGTQYGSLKRYVCKLGTNGFVSTALRDAVKLDGPIIPNSYNADIFRFREEIRPDRDVVFLGRLTRVKGVDLLVEAIALAAKNGTVITASIIGTGPEEAALKRQAENAGVLDRIVFTGALRGEALAQTLSHHRIAVVPSRWEEPFGIVALEALASGCVVAVADSGALPEVIGPCGPVFKKGDAASLAATLEDLVKHPDSIARYRANIPAHLEGYTRRAQMDASEALLDSAISGS